jgi:hypothetical protein
MLDLLLLPLAFHVLLLLVTLACRSASPGSMRWSALGWSRCTRWSRFASAAVKSATSTCWPRPVLYRLEADHPAPDPAVPPHAMRTGCELRTRRRRIKIGMNEPCPRRYRHHRLVQHPRPAARMPADPVRGIWAGGPADQTIVVDNASADGSADMVAGRVSGRRRWSAAMPIWASGRPTIAASPRRPGAIWCCSTPTPSSARHPGRSPSSADGRRARHRACRRPAGRARRQLAAVGADVPVAAQRAADHQRTFGALAALALLRPRRPHLGRPERRPPMWTGCPGPIRSSAATWSSGSAASTSASSSTSRRSICAGASRPPVCGWSTGRDRGGPHRRRVLAHGQAAELLQHRQPADAVADAQPGAVLPQAPRLARRLAVDGAGALWHRLRAWRNRPPGRKTERPPRPRSRGSSSRSGRRPGARPAAGGSRRRSPGSEQSSPCSSCKEDWRNYEGDLTRQGLWVMLVYRFGRWRYRFQSRWVRLPLSILYKILKLLVADPDRHRPALRGRGRPPLHDRALQRHHHQRRRPSSATTAPCATASPSACCAATSAARPSSATASTSAPAPRCSAASASATTCDRRQRRGHPRRAGGAYCGWSTGYGQGTERRPDERLTFMAQRYRGRSSVCFIVIALPLLSEQSSTASP